MQITPLHAPKTTMDLSFIQTFEGFLALLVLYCFWRAIANKTKHKKIGIPEPSGAWPLIGHLPLLGGHNPICKILGAMADKYGPIYSLKLGYHRLLVVSGWEIVKDCFTTNDRILATRPSIAVGRYIGYDNAIFALAPYGQYWRDVRKMATIELLSSHRLESLKHIRFSELDTFIKDLYILCAQSADYSTQVTMGKLLEHLTFNINLKMIVGKRFASNTYDDQNSEAYRYKKAIEQALFLSGVFVMGDAIPFLEWLDIPGHVSSMKRTAKEIDSVVGTWLEEHIQKKLKGEVNGEKDLMDAMLSTLPEDAVMSGHTRDTVIKATAMILTFTGAESTSVTITWVLSLLLNHPTVLKAAQEELDIHVGKDKWVQESDIKNLKYLQAIVKETLRLYPPGPVTGLREAMEDCNIGGYHVPKGTRLIVNIWKLQRDPRVWTDPCEYKPERFLTTHANFDVQGQNFEYIPFSSGRRSCPGVTFGLQVVHLTVARILQGFDLTTVADMPVDMQEGLGIALPKVNPLEVVIAPRLPAELYQAL